MKSLHEIIKTVNLTIKGVKYVKTLTDWNGTL